MFVPSEEGVWIDENYARLAEVIQEYDPYLRLEWIPPDKRTREDKNPYRVVDTRTYATVFFASELDKPHEILARLFYADNRDVTVLQKLEAEEDAKRILQMKEWAEKLEEAKEQANFMINTPLHYIKMGKDKDGRPIKMDETRRRIS